MGGKGGEGGREDFDGRIIIDVIGRNFKNKISSWCLCAARGMYRVYDESREGGSNHHGACSYILK